MKFTLQQIDGAFDAAGQEYGVDPDILRGIAWKESDFSEDVITGKRASRAGALGLMQFMPGTAEEYGIDPLNPVEAIFGAAAYMRDSLDKFNGDYERAVASYNAGRNRRAFDAPDWLDRMPEETRGYVGPVLEFADELRRLRTPKEPERNPQQPLPAGVVPSQAGAGRGGAGGPTAAERSEAEPSTGIVDSFAKWFRKGMDEKIQAQSMDSPVKDVGLAAAQGIVDVARLPGTAYGLVTGDMDNALNRGLAERSRRIGDDKSEAFKAESAKLQARMDEAEGVREKFAVGLVDTLTNPTLLVDQIARQLPGLAAGGAVGQAAGAGLRAGTGAMAIQAATRNSPALANAAVVASRAAGVAPTAGAVGAAAGLQGQEVGTDTLEQALAMPLEAYRANDPRFGELVAGGMSEEDARQVRAEEMARIATVQAGAASVALQALPGMRAIETAMLRKPVQAMAGGRIGQAVSVGAKESVSEGAEEALGSVARDRQLGAVDPTIDLLGNAAGAAGQGAGLGALMGGTVGAMQPRQSSLLDSMGVTPVKTPDAPAEAVTNIEKLVAPAADVPQVAQGSLVNAIEPPPAQQNQEPQGAPQPDLAAAPDMVAGAAAEPGADAGGSSRAVGQLPDDAPGGVPAAAEPAVAGVPAPQPVGDGQQRDDSAVAQPERILGRPVAEIQTGMLIRMANSAQFSPQARELAAAEVKRREVEFMYSQREAGRPQQEAAILENARDQQVEQADALTRAADDGAPTAMQLAMQRAREKRGAATAGPEVAGDFEVDPRPDGTLRVSGDRQQLLKRFGAKGAVRMPDGSVTFSVQRAPQVLAKLRQQAADDEVRQVEADALETEVLGERPGLQEPVLFSRGPADSGKAEDFVPAPEGGLEFGEITPAMGQGMRRQAGKVRLEVGNMKYGLRHIEARHMADIKALGYDSVPEFVADALRNVQSIWLPDVTSQLVVAEAKDARRAVFIQLKPARDEAGDFYTVNTAFPVRSSYYGKSAWKKLWEAPQGAQEGMLRDDRAQSSPAPGGQAPFAAPAPGTGGPATIPSDQSTPESVANQGADVASTSVGVQSPELVQSPRQPGETVQEPTDLTPEEVNRLAQDLTAGWQNAPQVEVIDDFTQAPRAVRDENDRQLSRGAAGRPEGFFYGGKVYLVASELRTEEQVARVLMHETLGHYGLRGVFGEGLAAELRKIAIGRGTEVSSVARRYGLDPMKREDRLVAAEEVLAFLAQEQPTLGIVRRAVAAVRTWLRQNIRYFADLELSDGEIIRDFILPARGWVQAAGRPVDADEGGATVAGDQEQEAVTFSRSGGSFDLPAFGRIAKFQEAVQNRYNRWKQAIDAVRKQGGIVNEANDFYLAEERYWGSVGSQMEDFNDEVKDFVAAVQRDGLELSDVAMYAYAMHAAERNAHIAKINSKMPDGGSGMTNDEAQAILDDAKAAGLDTALTRHAATLKRWTDGTRALLLSNGLITQDEFDAWSSSYSNYVPLRGQIGAPEGKRGTGKGFDVRGKEAIRAMGRRTQAENIIENILQDRARVLIRSGKNEVLRRFTQFVLDNPDPSLWEVNAVERKRSIHQTPNGEEVVDRDTVNTAPENTVAVKDAGATIYVTVKDERLLQQLKNLNNETVGTVVGALLWANRQMSRMYTSLNPVFTVINGVRDVTSGTVNMVGEAGFTGAGRMLAALPRAAKEAFQAEVGGKRSSLYQQYRAAGGKTGFFDFKTIDDQAKALQRTMANSKRSKANPLRFGRALLEAIEQVNAGVENTTRFASFIAARDGGASTAEAARIAKNLTVNFNRKGTMTPQLSALFLFFNPAVQGTVRTYEALKSPKVQATVGLGMMGIAALAVMNAAVGDDDDGVAWWDKIPAEVKERNLVIVLPPGATGGEAVPGSKVGRYIKIPMPYGYNVFAVMANNMVDMARNAADPARGVGAGKAASRVMQAFLGSWMPVQELGRSLETPEMALLAAVPDALNPIAQNIANLNSFGRAMYPDDQRSEAVPDSQKYFGAHAGTVFQKGAKALNELTGGSNFKEGLISITPASLENLARGYGGGVASFILDTLNAAYARQGIERDELEWRRAPFIKQLYGQIDAETDRMLGYARLDEISQVAEPVKRAVRAGDLEAAIELQEDGGPLAKLGKAAEVTRNRLAKLRKSELSVIESERLTDGQKNERLRLIDAERQMTFKSLNKVVNSALRADETTP